MVWPIALMNGKYMLAGKIEVEVQDANDTSWEKTNCIIPVQRPIPHDIRQKLAAGASLPSSDCDCWKEPHFRKEGDYRVRVKYYSGYADNPYVYSNVQHLVVINYAGQDSLAYEYLKEISDVGFLMPPDFFSKAQSAAEIQVAELIGDSFPQSKFAEYAHFFLCRAYLNKAITIAYYTSPNIEDGLQYLRLVRKHARAIKTDAYFGMMNAKSYYLETTNALYTLYGDKEPPHELLAEFREPFK